MADAELKTVETAGFVVPAPQLCLPRFISLLHCCGVER